MTRCALCGAECVPMADYTIPVCGRCDDRHEQALARLAVEMPAPRAPIRPWRGIYGPAAAEVAKTLIDPHAPPGRPEDIAALLDIMDALTWRAVRAQHKDRAA